MFHARSLFFTAVIAITGTALVSVVIDWVVNDDLGAAWPWMLAAWLACLALAFVITRRMAQSRRTP